MIEYITGPDVVEWLSAKVGGHVDALREPVGLGMVDSGVIVGAAVYDDWNGCNINGHLALDRPFTRKFIALMFHYPFVQLGCERMTFNISSRLHNVVELGIKMGSRLEAIQQNFYNAGEDRIILVMQKCVGIKLAETYLQGRRLN